MRIFSRGSPKTAGNSNDTTDGAGKEPSRLPLFPLQDVSWNSFSNEGKTDLLNTPRSVVKWLSSTPLPDPPFFESQENFAFEKPLLSLQSNQKMKLAAKDSKLKFLGAADGESTATSLRSLASSGGLQDALNRNPNTEQKSFHATPNASTTNELDTGTSGEIQVARSLKYSQATAGAGTTSQPGSTANPPLPATSLNSCAQTHFEIEEDPNFWKDHNVQVVIRLRPLSGSELATQGHSRCIRQDSAHAVTWTGHPESRFTFDLVACETITQEKIFKVAGLPMVDNCLVGYNSCMFAYGQTGSGKTFTMLGDLEGAHHRPSSNRGMTPRVFEYLFSRIQEEEEARKNEQLKFMCKCSFLEIYNEQILDLLDPATANLQMREDARKGVYVENLSEVEVKSVQDVITLLLQGAANRKVAATNMNRESSRSHSVFTCVIESKWTSQSVKNSRYGRLNLVDLAGSERQKSSGAEGERLKEAANINKSLSTLGLVIMSLVDIANGKQRHVPYRDSKLTFLLHDSLGGNSKTTIIANISPSKCCALETLSTLKFAQRAKFIRNNAIVNENALGDVMALRLKIQRLEEENNRLRLGGSVAYAELHPEGIMGSDGSCLDLADHGSVGHSAYSFDAWDPFRALGTPSISSKQKKGLELALQKSLQREQIGEARIRELQAEIEQFKCLVKQREEDTQSGKMMLRFREDKIKRMESVLGGLISPDTYLSEERDSLLEEVQILRNRLERNPEVTRFAMENIRLQEELHRYQVFYEAGERDMMEKEISILQEQLLEALDWKLMHEQDPISSGEGQITQQDALTKEKISFENQVDSSKLEKQIETVGAVASMQAELIAMRDAVVAAKEAETEARERVSLLIAEVEGLQRGLRDLQEENANSDIQTKVKQLENENAELRSIYESAILEHQMLSENFNKDLESVKERSEEEIQEMRSLLLAAQEDLKKMRREQNVQDEEALMKYGNVSQAADAEEAIKLQVCAEEMTTDSTLLNEHDNNATIKVLQEKVAHLQEANASLSALYECAVADKDALNRKLCESQQIARDADYKGPELSRHSHSQISMMGENPQQVQENFLDFINLDRDTMQQEFTHLENRVAEVQGENSRLLSMYNSALLDKERLSEELNMCQIRSAKNEDEMQDLRSSLKVAEETLQNIRLMHSRFEESTQEMLESSRQYEEKIVESEIVGPYLPECEDINTSRKLLEDQCATLARMEGKFREMLQNVDRQFESLHINLDCVDVSAGVFGLDDKGLVARIENVCTEMIVLLSIIDESMLEKKRLHEDLEQTVLRLRDANEARDDACLLSTVEKGKWMEERRILQERLDTALNLCNTKEKVWNDSLEAFQLKLDLVDSKLLDLSSVVDGTVLCIENKWEGMKESLTQTFFAIFKLEKETDDVEERHHLAQLRLNQLQNKVRALRKVLDGFSTTKLDWCSREERLQDHVQMLSGALAEKEMEVFELKTEEDNFRSCLDQLIKCEEILMLEMAAFKEKLQTTDQLQVGAPDHNSGQSANSAFSMLQLLRGQEEKATLLSVIAEQQEKLKLIKADIENMKACIDKKETALLCAQVEREAAASSLQEAEAELEEIKREKHILLETEAGAKAEFETLRSLHLEAESEETKLTEQLESSRQYLQELKERFAQAELDWLPFSTEIIDNVQQNKSTVTEMLLETQKFLLDIKSAVQVLAK